MHQKPHRADIIAGAVIFLILWAYLFLRAIHVPLVHDEIATFFNYVQRGRFIPFYADWDANNHILNTFLTILSYKMFGFSEFALRLPNLLIAPVYFLFTFRLSMQLGDRKMAWLLVSVLWGTHFIFEFFALARGYGMSMAFLFASLWYLFLALKYNRLRHYAATLGWMVLAILANLNLIISFLIIITILLTKSFLDHRLDMKRLISRVTAILALGVVPASLAVMLLFVMRGKELLYYGIEAGFWKATMMSLVGSVFGTENLLIAIIAAVFFILILVLTIYIHRRRFKIEIFCDPVMVFPVLLFGNLLAIILIHYLLDVNYPQDRTAMYLIPFFAGSLFFLTGATGIQTARWPWMLIFIPFLVIPAHFIFTANLTHTTIWKSQIIPQSYFDTVKNDQANGEYSATLGAYRMRTLFWYYLNYKEGVCLNPVFDQQYPTLEPDYLIVEPEILPEVRHKYDTIGYYHISDHYLLRRKELPERKLLTKMPAHQTTGDFDGEYFLIAAGALDTLNGSSLYFGIDLTIKSEREPFWSWVVLEIRDENDAILRYQYISLPYLKKRWTGARHNFRGGLLVPQTSASTEYFRCYIWNMELAEFSLGEGTLVVFRLTE